MTLVPFPDNGRARSVEQICAEFCARWRGTDVAEGARLLQGRLPDRIPGGLRLVIVRALRQIDLPSFESPVAFRAAVRRFAVQATDLTDISDVRRARRESRITLDRLARETGLPKNVLLQLEWGDFRGWHDEEWTHRVCRAYARGAALSPDRIAEIVEKERTHQLNTYPIPTSRRSAQSARRHGLAAAAVFAVGLLSGVLLTDRAEPPTARQAANAPAGRATAAIQQESRTETPRRTEPERPARNGATAPVAAAGTSPLPEDLARQPRDAAPPTPHLRQAPVGPASFSPAFSSAGGAVFYHQDEGAGSALMKTVSDPSTGDLRIVRIVEDGARNYHAKPSPDGTRIAFDSDRDGERGVYVANSDGSGVVRVSGPGFAAVPSWSPDGSRLAFVRGEPSTGNGVWNLWVLDLASNASVRLTSYRYGQPWGASWFPDGRQLAYSHEDRLHVLDLETGARRTFRSPLGGRLLRTPAVSPDGRHIVFQIYRDGVWLLDLENESMRRILSDPTAEEFAWDEAGRRLAFHSRRSGAWSVWIMSAPDA